MYGHLMITHYTIVPPFVVAEIFSADTEASGLECIMQHSLHWNMTATSVPAVTLSLQLSLNIKLTVNCSWNGKESMLGTDYVC